MLLKMALIKGYKKVLCLFIGLFVNYQDYVKFKGMFFDFV